jgi:tetratricopeptide (TPR) repeat protein
VDVPAITTVVRWIGIDEPMVSRDLGEQVAFTADGFEFPAVALLTHAASTEGPGVSAPLLIAPGAPRAAPTPLSWLQVRKSERGDLRAERARADVMARFAAAAASGPDAELLAGLANFQAAQERSSPFETLEERTELPETCLARFRSAALAREPGPYVRRLWDMLARILSRKRWVEETYTYLQPVADRYPAWPALQIALARADLESLAPEEAAARLDALAEVAAPSFELFELLGSTRCALGEPAKALEAWKRAAPLPTTDRAARRKVVLAVARAGDTVGIEAATKLLMELPSDSDLREVLGRPANLGPISDPCSN